MVFRSATTHTFYLFGRPSDLGVNLPRMETKGGPKPKPTGSLIPNPSVPGIQKPNTPTGKNLPPAEKR
jgi:hypothetical protein